MAIQEYASLIDNYLDWLRRKISIQEVEGICEITTPFLDRHNDHIQIYAKRHQDGTFIITDAGYTIRDLQLSGCEINSEKRTQLLKSILNGFGISIQKEELFVTATTENFPQKKHNLLQAILSINDLFVLAAPMVANFFKEDVARYLRMHDIRFITDVKFPGKSSFDHFFDFVIPESKNKPERILSVINNPNRQRISSLIFSTSDIHMMRESNFSTYGILNDLDHPVSDELITALRQYDIKSIVWSRRDEHLEELAA